MIEGKGAVDGRAQRIAGLICGFLALFTIAFASSTSARSGHRFGTGDTIKVTVFGEEDASGADEVAATAGFRSGPLGPVRSVA